MFNDVLRLPIKPYKYIHLLVSIALFFTCLFLPGYYLGDTYIPLNSAFILLNGWLGPINGHYSWFANPLFFIAIFLYKKPQLSFILCSIAMFFALSFLNDQTIIVNAKKASANISGYGWGYFLWVLSIGIFLLGQLTLSILPRNKRLGLFLVFCIQFLWVAIASITFFDHYYQKEGSANSFEKTKKALFEEKCRTAGTSIFKENLQASSIYYEPALGFSYSRRSRGSGALGIGSLNSGMIEFYEKNNARPTSKESPAKYRRYFLNNTKGIEVDTLKSEYSVITKNFQIPKKFGMFGAEVLIKDMKDNSIVAKSIYIYDQANHKFCGDTKKGYFSVSKFVIDALNLTKRYPSAYDKK